MDIKAQTYKLIDDLKAVCHNYGIPSKDILTQFNQRVALIYEFMHNNLEETSKLQHLRDWLLPMLMNGQATISD